MSLFFELIQLTLKNRDLLSKPPSDQEWKTIFLMSQKQAITGFIMGGLEILSQRGFKPSSSILYEWIAVSEQIKQQNIIVNRRCKEICEIFDKANLKTCVLKGQGNALMYPNPFARMPGDIDLWVDDTKSNIINFLKASFENIEIKMSSHHVDFPIFNDVDVEVHYLPTYSLLLRYQAKLDIFFDEYRKQQFSNIVCLPGIGFHINVPTDTFNIVFQLSHMQRHFFKGGIGLRHILDYYFLLIQSYSRVNTNEIKTILNELGLLRFAQAVMWILKNALGMDEKYLLTEIDKKRGQLLLDEIMKGGNLGHYDQRLSRRLRERSTTLSLVARNIRMVWLFPEEAISAPITGVVRRYIKK